MSHERCRLGSVCGRVLLAAGLSLASGGLGAGAAESDKPAVAPAVVAPQAESPKPNGPRIACDEPMFNFGEIWVGGQPLRHAFTIRNTGSEVLSILKVQPHCGCTAAGPHPNTIAPGESGQFPFQVDPNKVHGKFAKTINVESNDPQHPQLQLTLSGELKHYVDVQPVGAYFGTVKPEETRSVTLTVTNKGDEPLSLRLDDTRKHNSFSADIKEVDPGQKFVVTVTAKPPYAGKYNGHLIELVTNNPKEPRVRINCSATVPNRLDLNPESIYLSAPSPTAMSRPIVFNNNGDTSVKVLSAGASDPAIQVDVREVAPGKRYMVTATLPPNYAPPATSDTIVIKTDDEKQPELKLLIRGPARPVARPAVAQRPPEDLRPALKLDGKPAPTAKLVTREGKEVTLGKPEGKAQFVTFYASWCGHCKKNLPIIDKVRKEYADKGVDMLAVNLDARTGPRAYTEEKTLETYNQLNLDIPLAMKDTADVGAKYLVRSFPTMFLISKDGTIEQVHVGAPQPFEDILKKELDDVLAGKTKKADPPTAGGESDKKAAEAQPAGDTEVKPAAGEDAKPAGEKSAAAPVGRG